MAIQIRTSLAEPETGEGFVPHKPVRPDKAEGGKRFNLVSDYEPAGDQPTAIRELVEGADLLFTNEYEAGLVRDKTGWTEGEVLERVGTRVTTHGAEGVLVQRRGEPDVRVPVAPARTVVEPTGVGDAFRAGFLAALSWGLGHERAAQLGCLLAVYVVEQVGTQEYEISRAAFLERCGATYGDEAVADFEPHLQTIRQ